MLLALPEALTSQKIDTFPEKERERETERDGWRKRGKGEGGREFLFHSGCFLRKAKILN